MSDVTRFSLLPRGQALATEYWPLARRAADRLAARYPYAEEEMRAAVLFALCGAAARFQPERGVSFATLAFRSIDRGVMAALRNARAACRDHARLVPLGSVPEPAAPEADANGPGPAPSRAASGRPRILRPGEGLTAFGETQSLRAWGRDPRCVVSFCALRYRVRGGMEPERAITTPRNHV